MLQLAVRSYVFPFPGPAPVRLLKQIEPPLRSRTMREMAEYSYLVLYLPRGMPRDDARRILTNHAEYGRWELARLRLYADGSRKATLRRQIIRPTRTARPPFWP
jgi:hypothetical protein